MKKYIYNETKGKLEVKIMLKDILKEMRLRVGLKQSDIAEYVGVTPQTYMKWENGKNEPKASNLKKLAECLKVTETELCRGERFHGGNNPIEFMKKTAQYQDFIDEVTFTSVLFDYIQDKKSFLKTLDEELKKIQGFTSEEISNISDEELYGANEYKKHLDRTTGIQG